MPYPFRLILRWNPSLLQAHLVLEETANCGNRRKTLYLFSTISLTFNIQNGCVLTLLQSVMVKGNDVRLKPT